MIQWFQAIENKFSCTSICFDIVDLYPSISEKLIEEAVEWAKKRIKIGSDELDAIYNSRKSLLFSKNKAWVKRNSSSLLDVTMGSYDWAEICELVGLYALAKLPERFQDKSIGLYRDDGLGVLESKSGAAAERTKKELTDHFKTLGLRITIETNLKITNFLDLTLNLNNGKYYPY